MNYGELHPIVLHFPLVLLTFACILDVICYFIQNKQSEELYRYVNLLVYLSLLTMIPTIVSGFFAAYSYPPSSLDIETHRTLALFTFASMTINAFIRAWGQLDTPILSRKHALYLNILSFGLITLTGDVGGVITHGKSLMVPEDLALKPINYYKEDSIQVRSYDPEKLQAYLSRKLGVNEAALVMKINHCAQCHAEQFSNGLPENFSKKMGSSPIWLPRDKNGHLDDWKNSAFYKTVILRNRMPYTKEHEPIGLSWADRLTLLHWLENDAPFALPQMEKEEQEEQEEQDINEL